MEFKSLDINEQPSTPGTFSGWASRYFEKDSFNDVVMPGAFDKTVQEHGGEIVILADHDPNRSIGLARMTLKPEGLWIDAKLSLDLTDGRDTYIRMRDLKKTGLSIGYMTREDRAIKDGGRALLDIHLMEVSTVQFPALESARVLSVKDRSDAADLKRSLETLTRTIRSMRIAAERATDPLDRMESNIRKLRSFVS